MNHSMKARLLRSAGAAVAVLLAQAVPASEPKPYGIGLYGPADLKLGPDEPFPYVNPAAPKGGTLVLSSQNFTTLNPFALKGLAAPLVAMVFESPTIKSQADNEPFSTYGHLVERIEVSEDRLSLTYTIRE
jgi:ABC-type oligopeptide transport system substrate-binding subunit